MQKTYTSRRRFLKNSVALCVYAATATSKTISNIPLVPTATSKDKHSELLAYMKETNLLPNFTV
jgi:hypothetical protein